MTYRLLSDYRGQAPVCLQGGGKEILVDMIREFAQTLRDDGARVTLDVSPHPVAT